MMYREVIPPVDIEESAELDLVARMRDRDPTALREVYDRFGRSTFGYLVATIGDRGSAEDVQQQVFLEVWQKIDRYDRDRGSFTTWVMTITRSRAIDHMRRRVPEPRDPTVAGETAEVGGAAIESEADRILEQWHFAQLMSRLPDEEAELLRMRFDGDLSQSEIAERTGIPIGTIKTRMVSGLGRLREIVERES